MRRCLVLFAFLVATPVVAHADEVRSTLMVSATVAPRVTLDALQQPSSLAVSDDDVARGYVDVTAVYRVRNNDPAGYTLRFEPRVGLATAVEVDGLAAEVVMRDETIEVTQPAAIDARELMLRYRVVLDPAVPSGTYPMPVRVSASTL